MGAIRLGVKIVLLSYFCCHSVLWADPPLCTTQFFDWYVTSEKRPVEKWQRHWTYRVDWGAFGISPGEIGKTVHYYEVQFQKIREAGFDGIHYEWHNNNPKPQFIEAAKKVRVPLAMFYDMQIRFHKRKLFITPTDEFAKEVVADVSSFYRSVPKSLWLHDRKGKLPIVVYGYAFDQKVSDPAVWHRFYRAIIDGVEKQLAERVVFHWTNNGSPQQMYGFQHFPEIQSYIFNEASRQTQVNAHSVTFVVHYDDLGVSFARKGGRKRRWIRNDIRYLQEALWLAKHTDPDLVFNYGWNELYEGEHLLPDAHWGTWRYDVASAMVKDIKANTKADLPRALIIVDDFLPGIHGAPRQKAAMLRREMKLLTRLRAFVPQAEVVLSGSGRDLSEYKIIFGLNSVKHRDEEAALAKCGKRVVYANPNTGVDTSMTRIFTSQVLRPLQRPDLGPVNEFVVASRKVDVDLKRFPMLQYRCRNSADTMFHIRYRGLNAAGEEVEAWYESSPTDDQQSQGKWAEGQADVAKIAKRGAGQDILRLTRIEIILDDGQANGDFALDIDFLRMTNGKGEVGWQDEFETIADWTVHASFQNAPGGRERFGFTAVEVDGQTIGHMTLKAVSSDALTGPVDEATRQITPTKGVRILFKTEANGVEIPIVLAKGNSYFLNTYSPTEECWAAFMPKVLGAKLHRGVMFCSYSHSVTEGGVTSKTDEQLGVIREEELPMDRIRLVAPPELDVALPFTLPVGSHPLSLHIIRGERQDIPFPDPDSNPPAITLRPGEVVELRREK
ncbi:MAG: hypothetical protein GXP25_18205 [Planctomycetes bacterium]|nr:hypothetical protein [Planctomycetota bacterium]